MSSIWNNQLLLSLISGLVGALLVEGFRYRKQTKDGLIQEIRNVNRALALIYNISNRGIGLKAEHVSKLKAEYDSERAIYLQAQANKQQYVPTMNLVHLLVPHTPIREAMQVVLEKTSVTGKAIHLLITLNESLTALTTCIDARNKYIQEASRDEGKLDARRFFGASLSSNVVDMRYVGIMEALYKANDDVIFFALTLGDELSSHAHEVILQYKNLYFCDEPPKVSTVSYGDRETHPHIPKAVQYQDWIDKFKRFPREKTCWERIKAKFDCNCGAAAD